MNDFLKLDWKVRDVRQLEPQNCFITEEALADSLVYKCLENKGYLFSKTKNQKPLFSVKSCIPGNSVHLPTFTKSTLDSGQHAQCLKAFKLLQSGKCVSKYTSSEQFFIQQYNAQKHKIHLENTKYQAFVQNKWENDKIKLSKITQRIITYGKYKWEGKCKQVFSYPQHFKEALLFNVSPDQNKSAIEFNCIQNLLEVGTVAKVTCPNLKTQCKLTCVSLPPLKDNVKVNSKVPVSQDMNITKLLKTHSGINIVIPMSSLKRIADNSDLKDTWMIPLAVKEIEINQEDGTLLKKRIAFVERPFPSANISKLDLAELSFKALLKSNFCVYKGFDYEGEDIPFTSEERQVVNYNSDAESDNNLNVCGDSKKSEYHVHHNATYRLWNIKKTDCQSNLMKNRSKAVDIKVLVRTKLHGCEIAENGALQPVILTPKLERQIHYGANIPSKSQLANEWASLFFRPFSTLYRVRLAPTVNEVVAIEKCPIQKVVSEAQTHYNYKPNLGLYRVQKTFEEICNLEPGNYLIQHLPKHESFVCILKESDKSESTFNLHNEYNENRKVNNISNGWLPIDVNVILPAFEAEQRMPAMFTPFIKGEHFKKGAKKPIKKSGKKNKKETKKAVKDNA